MAKTVKQLESELSRLVKDHNKLLSRRKRVGAAYRRAESALQTERGKSRRMPGDLDRALDNYNVAQKDEIAMLQAIAKSLDGIEKAEAALRLARQQESRGQR